MFTAVYRYCNDGKQQHAEEESAKKLSQYVPVNLCGHCAAK
jgi:hypothetical protein